MTDDKYYIIVASNDVDYGEEGAVEYLSLTGVVGPFDTRQEASDYDRVNFMARDYRTEVTKLTPPGGDIWNTKYNIQ